MIVKYLLFTLLSVLVTACSQSSDSSPQNAVAPKEPGVVAPAACADSALLARTWRSFVVSGHAADVTANFSDDCTVRFSGSQCPSTWRVVGRTDQTWTVTETVMLELVSVEGPYNAWCPRPEMSPYVCSSNSFYDSGLGKQVVALSCDKGFSAAIPEI